MKLGVTRHGPDAPDAFQFGKYDDFTRTGTPTRDTSNEMRSSDVRMFDTRTDGNARDADAGGDDTFTPVPIGRTSPFGSVADTRGHADGPDDARGVDQRDGSSNQGADTSSQSFAAWEMPLTTAGVDVSASTSDESATR